MRNKKYLIFFLTLFLLNNCSFGDKTGFWNSSEEEKERVDELEKKQREIIDTVKIYSSENLLLKEKSLNDEIVLSNSKKNKSWEMSGLNNKNFIGNIYLSGIDNIFLKKRIGKNKFSHAKNITSLLISNSNIILSDDSGAVFNINQSGKINWKKNIYTKIYKRINKNLTYAIYKNKIYIADNIGFIYALNLNNGELIWIKNHGVPIKSKIKIFKDKIFLIDQDNLIFSLRINDGTKIWDVRSIASFIKLQNFLSLAISDKGYVFAITSSGDLINVNGQNGDIQWSLNTSVSMLADATDFFTSSDIVIEDQNLFFSSGQSTFSYNLEKGTMNWEQSVSSIGTPIIDKKYIFFVNENGYFLILNKNTGEIISSTNILRILKKKKQSTKITGFIMGEEKIYSVTSNGYLIVSSAKSGKVEDYRKIGDPIFSSPIINDGKMFLLTENSKVFGFN